MVLEDGGESGFVGDAADPGWELRVPDCGFALACGGCIESAQGMIYLECGHG